MTLQVTSVSGNAGGGGWPSACFCVFLGVIALLGAWRGRDRAAAGLTLWATAFLTAVAISYVTSNDSLEQWIPLAAWISYLTARVGFYVMAESMVAGVLRPRARAWWRAGFLVLLGVAAVRSLVGPIILVATGWAELLQPAWGLVVSAVYLPAVALLIATYRRAEVAQRLRLRWMIACSGVFVVSIFLNNTPLLGPRVSLPLGYFLAAVAGAGLLYTILRHRVVDFTVVLNHALVYAGTTSFVLGLFALFESLIERTTLGHDASLVMELAVPLGLGVSLSTVHRRIDALVDRLVFRRQYREEVALRRFAKECPFVTQPESLLDLALEQITLHTSAPWVGMYEHTPDGYSRIRQRGTRELPPIIPIDDLALVKLRAHEAEVNLHESPSGIAAEGYAFPMRVRGRLLGLLVVGPRPGEHSVADERELLAHVAHEVGAALFALRAEASEARAQASETQLQESRAREKTLLEALRGSGAPVAP
ncbi:MAG: GAF domain-containing protein [Steroidobacteraceae bacterium]